MKKLLFTTLLLAATVISAQREIDSLTYEQTQDITHFKEIKNRTQVKKYITINKNVIKIGDTVSLGNPTNQELNSKTYSANYGNQARAGIASTRSTTKKTYDFIKMGRPAGFGSIMNSLNGDDPSMASNTLKNSRAVVSEIKAYHRGSKKKPLYLVMVLGEINGKAFGINKYLSVMDLELAIESGEILLQNRKMTREEAITKIKEAKELFEIDMMTKDEFDALKEELRPIITGN
tara:strand:+ start:646 stop:1347 length:702 start_codon:yes stop_codon:yes gene_type:complete